MNSDVLVIGGGIAGMQAALLLAEKDHRVHVLDSAPALGGFFPLLDRQFPTNSCGVCFMSPRPPAYCPIYESDFHSNIELLTNCDVQGLTGQAGDFEVSYVQRPRYVDPERCTSCGKCVEVCPVEVEKERGTGLRKRKAIFVPIGAAIPRTYSIDDENCSKCGKCVKVCSPGAINLNEMPAEKKLKVGAVVLGFGFEPFQATQKGEYGLGRYGNVVTSIQYERMLSSASAAGGYPVRLSDGTRAKKVAFIQCVGSRDPSCDRGYCSSICCMYATKQAMVSKDRDGCVEAAIFYMDLRAVGKDYERYCERAKQEYGVRYVRSAISTIREMKQTGNLLLEYGIDGERVAEEFDLVVLSVGFTPPAGIREVAGRLGIGLNEYGFCETPEVRPTETSVPGIYVAGAFREPRDIPETVLDASCASANVSVLLDDFAARGSAPVPAEEEEALDDEDARIGVFICDNAGSLSESLEVDRLVASLEGDGAAVSVSSVDVASLKGGIRAITEKVDAEKLNGVVIAGHKGMALGRALAGECEGVASGAVSVEHANIGEQCADVHGGNAAVATDKALSLVRAAMRKAFSASARRRRKRGLEGRVLVVGGGVAGMSSSLALAEQGMEVTLVEKSNELGGNARTAHYTVKGTDVPGVLSEMIAKVESHPKIELLKGAELKSLEGTWGSFRSVVAAGEDEKQVVHGAVIFATGGREITTDEYLLGKNPKVVSQKQFEAMLAGGDPRAVDAKSVVMIQCVGSRDEKRPYCSRVCCTHAMKNILKLKESSPDAEVTVLYRDVRTYGFFEGYYHAARGKGAVFVRYDPESKPEVSEAAGGVQVAFTDPVTGDALSMAPDLLVLSTGIEPADNGALAEVAGVKLNADGFFMEANPKAAPLDSVDRGKYFCGLCHSPNHIEDAIVQGKAAAARASSLLWSGVAELADNLAFVDERRCSGCGLCVTACPYQAREIDLNSNVARVLEDLCKGCGTCVVSCPNGASQQQNFERRTIMDVMDEVIA